MTTVLDDWIRAVIETRGMTALHDEAEAHAMLVADALRAVEIVRELPGPIVDVGSGGGSPGIPIALALPDREVVLLEAERRKCDFLERWAPPNARVVWGRAEEQEVDVYGVALAKALAPPPVAAELCLPLVRPGGAVLLWVGPSAVLRVVGQVSRAPRRRRARGAGRPRPRAQARADSGRIPAPGGHAEEASARVGRMGAWPGSTRSPIRRAGSARRRPRSTSPRASRRPASARSSSTSTRRRTRPRVSACVRTAPRATTSSTAPRSPSSRSTRRSRTSTSCPSKPDLAGAVVELAQRGDGERYLAQALASGTSQYDFVFIDCPPSLGPLTVNALAAADRVLVPVQAEYYALEGLTQLMQSIDLIRRRLNPRLGIGGVLMTMVDTRTRLAQDVEAEVRKHFGELVFRTSVPRSVRLAEAPSHGLPAIAYDRRSAGADAYWKVAMELVERS